MIYAYIVVIACSLLTFLYILSLISGIIQEKEKKSELFIQIFSFLQYFICFLSLYFHNYNLFGTFIATLLFDVFLAVKNKLSVTDLLGFILSLTMAGLIYTSLKDMSKSSPILFVLWIMTFIASVIYNKQLSLVKEESKIE